MNGSANRLASGKQPASSDAEVGEAALDWAIGAGVADRVERDLAVEMRRNRRRRIYAIAGGIAAALAFGLAWRHAVRDGGGSRLAATTAARSPGIVSLPATRILADGSVVELKERAEIAVDFSDAVRRVILLRGEAHFVVAKNPLRPFVVVARGVEVRAVGTAFSMELGYSTVNVVVTEGRVAVEKYISPVRSVWSAVALPPPAGAPSLRLLALVDSGNRVAVELAASAMHLPSVQPVSRPELDEKLSWRVPRLSFSGTPLAEVLAMFNEHSGSRIALADPTLGGLQISGVLRADNAESLLRLLELEFGIVAERRGDDRIVLRRR